MKSKKNQSQRPSDADAESNAEANLYRPDIELKDHAKQKLIEQTIEKFNLVNEFLNSIVDSNDREFMAYLLN